jgi:hypothetical protein
VTAADLSLADNLARHMEAVARALLGAPNRDLSNGGELRFGTNGSMSVDTQKGTFYSFEDKTGGGVIELIKRERGLDGPAAVEWMRNELRLDVGEGRAPATRRIVATYDYRDERGDLLSQVVRYDPKDFRQRRPDRAGGWAWSVKGVRQVPYRLPEMIAALAQERRVAIVEGEKDADAVARLGIPATCNIGGAGKWPDALSEHFRGSDVVIIPDVDPQAKNGDGSLKYHPDGRPAFTGQDHASDVAAKLAGVAKRVRILELPGPGKDASDWIEAGGTADELWRLVDARSVPAAAYEYGARPPAQGRLIQSSAEFVAGFVPPDYLVDGLIQRRFVYAVTAPPGDGKTCVALRIAAHAATGLSLGGREVEKVRVLFFAGENPDDVRMRWIKLCEEMKQDPADLEVSFLPGAPPIAEDQIRRRINAEVAERGPLGLLIVDTSAAYFRGDDENSNAQLGAHARMLRSFVGLPGGPSVIVTTHPTKHPDMDNLVPRRRSVPGGGGRQPGLPPKRRHRGTALARQAAWSGFYADPVQDHSGDDQPAHRQQGATHLDGDRATDHGGRADGGRKHRSRTPERADGHDAGQPRRLLEGPGGGRRVEDPKERNKRLAGAPDAGRSQDQRAGREEVGALDPDQSRPEGHEGWGCGG